MNSPAPPSAEALASAARLILRTGRTFEARVRGGSMGSAFRDGTWLRIEPVAPADLRRGDVIAFLKGNEIVAHRLVRRIGSARRGERLLALGDGNYFPDDAIEMDDLLGRTIAINAGDGWREVPSDAVRPLKVKLASRLITWIALALLPVRDRLRRNSHA